MTNSFPLHPDYRFQLIDHQFIDFPDDFLRFLHNRPIEPVVLRNLQEFGQLYPLLVQQQTENQYYLLADYLYFSAINTLGIKKIVCQILSPSIPPVTIFSLQILNDLSSPQSSPILQAHLLRKAQHVITEKKLLSLLSLMGYQPQRYKLKELLDLLQLEPSSILALHLGSLSLKSAKQLSMHTPEDQRYLTNLISSYRLGGSKQQKLIEMVTELTLRDNKSIAEIVNRWNPEQETVAENMPQRLHSLMQNLHEQCHPDSAAAEKNFKKIVQELQPTGGVTIAHNLSFEDESLEVRLRFSNASKLKEKWEKIKTVLQ